MESMLNLCGYVYIEMFLPILSLPLIAITLVMTITATVSLIIGMRIIKNKSVFRSEGIMDVAKIFFLKK